MSKSANQWTIILTYNDGTWNENPNPCHVGYSNQVRWRNASQQKCEIQFTQDPLLPATNPINLAPGATSQWFQVNQTLSPGNYPYTVQAASTSKTQANARSSGGTGGPIIIIDPAPPTSPETKKGGQSQREPELVGTGSKRR